MDEKDNTILKPFLDGDGRIKQLPASNKKKVHVLAYLAGKFKQNRDYTEKEVNGMITAWHTFNDYFILRRSLVDFEFLGRTRDGAKYWVIQQDDRGGKM